MTKTENIKIEIVKQTVPIPSNAPVTCPKNTGNLKKLNQVMVSWGDWKSVTIKNSKDQDAKSCQMK